jgi:1-acyl-sn-glycerol-3-phosphate acyltransferase
MIRELLDINSAKKIIYHKFPHALGDLVSKYFRVDVVGSDNIPISGPGILAPNHSGFVGLDALLLSHHIYEETLRTPRVLTHKLWFLTKLTAKPAKKLGFIKAKTENGIKTLHNENLLLIFPEGEDGNFKPTSKKYQLQPFRAGLVRMAVETGAPIIPTLVIGAEEANLNLAHVKFRKVFKGLSLPIPLNLVPFPTKWKIIFLPKFELKYGIEALYDEARIQEMAQDLRRHSQEELDKELKKRDSIFF